MDYGFSFVDSGAQWRFPVALQIFFALSTIAMIVWLPETPRWLLSHDYSAEAVAVLQNLYADRSPDAVDQERVQIIAAITHERQAQEKMGGQRYVLGSIKYWNSTIKSITVLTTLGTNSPLRMVFTNGEQRIFYRTMLGSIAMVMQQMTGINLIT